MPEAALSQYVVFYTLDANEWGPKLHVMKWADFEVMKEDLKDKTNPFEEGAPEELRGRRLVGHFHLPAGVSTLWFVEQFEQTGSEAGQNAALLCAVLEKFMGTINWLDKLEKERS